MVTTLLLITIAVFVVQQVLNVFFPHLEVVKTFHGRVVCTEFAELHRLKFDDFELRSHSTSGFFHILGNMLGLFFIGRILEPIMGRERFLMLYLGSIGGRISLPRDSF